MYPVRPLYPNARSILWKGWLFLPPLGRSSLDLGELQGQLQLCDPVVIRLRLGNLPLCTVAFSGHADLAAQFMEVLPDSGR